MATEDQVLQFLPSANIHIRKDAAFLPMEPSAALSVCLCRQLFCALSLPGLDCTLAA